MKEEIKRWWDQANEDLAAAKDNLEIKRYNVAIFLCEQSVEKGLKTLHLEKFKTIPRIHDLTIFAKKFDMPDKLFSICEDLTNIYTETRYPDMSGQIPANRFSRKEAKEFIDGATEVILWIKNHL